jgi:hypothetical protein
MSKTWPYDVKAGEPFTPVDPLRPFRCLLFMPFKQEYSVVAELVKTRFLEVAGGLFAGYNLHLPEIDRLDWVRSTGAIQDQIWQKLISADLIFCDISDNNPNVIFEAGVAAAWKPIHKVVFIKNKISEVKNPFDISPFRYIEYDLSSHSSIQEFKNAIGAVVQDAIIPFPDEQKEIKLYTDLRVFQNIIMQANHTQP